MPSVAIAGWSASTNQSDDEGRRDRRDREHADRQRAAARRRSIGASSRAARPGRRAIENGIDAGEHDEQDDRAEDAEVRGMAGVGRTGAVARVGIASAATARTSSDGRSSGPAGAEASGSPCRRPPRKNARPRTRRLLARIDPMSAVWTTTTRPAWRAKIEMNSSGQVAEGRLEDAGRAGPEPMPELVRPASDDAGQRRPGRPRDTTKTSHLGRAREAQDHERRRPWSRRSPRRAGRASFRPRQRR